MTQFDADENSQAIHAVIAEVRNESRAGWRGHDYRNVSKNRSSILFAIGFSILIHAVALWLLTNRTPDRKAISPDAEARMAINLVPPSVAHSPQQKTIPESPGVQEPRKIVRPHSAAKKRTARKTIDRTPADTQGPKTVPPDTVPRNTSVPDDMFTQIEAARKRRAEARGQSSEAEPEAAQNDNSVALANIARSLKHTRDAKGVEAGGVFEIRNMSYQSAELIFRGWNVHANRNSMRLIPVEKAANADIETAAVKKIIDTIREEKTGDFVWNSHRLGTLVTLSARPKDTAELQQFLMHEFFPDYIPAAPAR